MKRIAAFGVASILATASFVMVILGTAAPANADIRFCQTAKNVPCIGPVNGCSIQMGGGKYIFVDNGSSVLDNFGQRLTCRNGHWTATPARPGQEVESGSNLGRGLLTQGPPAEFNPCPPDVLVCPIFP